MRLFVPVKLSKCLYLPRLAKLTHRLPHGNLIGTSMDYNLGLVTALDESELSNFVEGSITVVIKVAGGGYVPNR